MEMPGRTYANGAFADDGYRFGFNGMLVENDLTVNGDAYDFGARIYRSTIGKWLSTDRVFKPHLSSYQFGKNNPIAFIDSDGNDEVYFNADGQLIKYVVTSEELKFFVEIEGKAYHAPHDNHLKFEAWTWLPDYVLRGDKIYLYSS